MSDSINHVAHYVPYKAREDAIKKSFIVTFLIPVALCMLFFYDRSQTMSDILLQYIIYLFLIFWALIALRAFTHNHFAGKYEKSLKKLPTDEIVHDMKIMFARDEDNEYLGACIHQLIWVRRSEAEKEALRALCTDNKIALFNEYMRTKTDYTFDLRTT